MDASTIGLGVGIGVIASSLGVGYGISMIYDAKKRAYEFENIAKIRIAQLSALEKLLDKYGNQMGPDEFKGYAASFGLVDIGNEE